MSSPLLPPATITEIEEMVVLYTRRRMEFSNLAKRVETDLIEHDAGSPTAVPQVVTA
jgi:hypothetical protein